MPWHWCKLHCNSCEEMQVVAVSEVLSAATSNPVPRACAGACSAARSCLSAQCLTKLQAAPQSVETMAKI